jgi:transcriptional antiterminator RfaH
MDTWFLIYCKPAQDTRAEENLHRQGYIVFRPTIKVNGLGRQRAFKRESLFPRYLFIKVDPEIKSIAPIQSTLGVTGFVKFGEIYATAPEWLIDKIKSDLDMQDPPGYGRDPYEQDDEMSVDGQGIQQIKALYYNPSGSERAMILMNILAKKSALTLPAGCLSKAG